MISVQPHAVSSRDLIWPKALRFFCWAAAICCFVLALTAPQYRDAEGFLRGGACFPIAAAIALGVLGYGISRQWRVAAFWLALALVGQAAAVQMVDAGQMVKYPHYRPIGALVAISPWLLVLMAFQTVFVVIGLRGRFMVIRSWLTCNFKFWQLAGFAVAFFITSATVSREVNLYLQELPLAAFIQAINLLNIIWAVWAIPESTLTAWRPCVERLTGWVSNDVNRVDRFAVVLAIGVLGLTVFLSIFSYERHPHIKDEAAYLYQARYLATGVLAMPTPPVLEAFNFELLDYDATRWFASPPVGWPLLLSIGVLLNAGWLVNPVFAGICILLAYVLISEMYDRRTAGLSAFFLALSPWFIFVGMSYMTHTSSLAFAILAALGTALARRTGKNRWALLSGLATGMVGMIRPLEGVILGSLMAAVYLILVSKGLNGKRIKITGFLTWCLGCALLGAAIFYYNYAITGSPTNFPIMAWAEKFAGHNSNAMGFGPDRGMGWALDPNPGHGPLDAIINSNLNITAINTELFGWSIGSLVLIMLFILLGKMRGADWLMVALILAVYTAHFFYWFSGGPDFGARYWFLMIVPCVVLTVRGLQAIVDRLTDEGDLSFFSRTRVLAAVLSLSLLTLVNFIPWRAIDKYHHYLGMRPDIRQMTDEFHFGNSLVLIRGPEFPDFTSAAIYNPIDLRAGGPVFAWDKSASVRKQLLQEYPGRQVWIVDGPTLTGKGFNIVEGPVPAQTLLFGGAANFQ